MSEVFNSYAKSKGVKESSLQFYIEDKEIMYIDTPDYLQLEDSCQIIAKRAMSTSSSSTPSSSNQNTTNVHNNNEQIKIIIELQCKFAT